MQGEADVGVLGPEAGDELGHEPRAEGRLERDDDGARGGVAERGERGNAVVELVQGAVDVSLERRAGLRHPQDTSAAAEQRHADLGLEAGEGAGDPALTDLLEIADLGDGDAVGHLLEPP